MLWGRSSYFWKSKQSNLQSSIQVLVECIQCIVDHGLISFVIQADDFLIRVMYSREKEKTAGICL